MSRGASGEVAGRLVEEKVRVTAGIVTVRLPALQGFLRLDLCNAPTGGVRPDVGKGGSTTREVDGSYGKPETTGFISPKVDVQAWPLSNTTVQEDLL